MFENLSAEGSQDAMRYLTSLLISIILHTAVLGVLVILPLVFFNVVQAEELLTILIGPPSPIVPTAPPATPVMPRAVNGITAVRGDIKEVPDRLPKGIPLPDDSPEAFDSGSLVKGIGNVAELVPNRDAVSRLLEATKPPELPPIIPPKPRTPVQVSGPIQEAKLIYKVTPIYPELAVRARVSGTVVLEALIDEEGSVVEIQALSGHPLLRDAAFDAVKQWKYLPTMIGGEPVRVMAVVTVIFRFR